MSRKDLAIQKCADKLMEIIHRESENGADLLKRNHELQTQIQQLTQSRDIAKMETQKTREEGESYKAEFERYKNDAVNSTDLWKRNHELQRHQIQQLTQAKDIALMEAQKAREERESYKAELGRHKNAATNIADLWQRKHELQMRLVQQLTQRRDTVLSEAQKAKEEGESIKAEFERYKSDAATSVDLWKRRHESQTRQIQQLTQGRDVALMEAQKAKEEGESYKAEFERYKSDAATSADSWKRKHESLAAQIQQLTQDKGIALMEAQKAKEEEESCKTEFERYKGDSETIVNLWQRKHGLQARQIQQLTKGRDVALMEAQKAKEEGESYKTEFERYKSDAATSADSWKRKHESQVGQIQQLTQDKDTALMEVQKVREEGELYKAEFERYKSDAATSADSWKRKHESQVGQIQQLTQDKDTALMEVEKVREEWELCKAEFERYKNDAATSTDSWKRKHELQMRQIQQLTQDKDVAFMEVQKVREERESCKTKLERNKDDAGWGTEVGRLQMEVQSWKSKYELATRQRGQVQKQLAKTHGRFTHTIAPTQDFEPPNSREHHSPVFVTPNKLNEFPLAEGSFNNESPSSVSDFPTNKARNHPTSIMLPAPALTTAAAPMAEPPSTTRESTTSSSSQAKLGNNHPSNKIAPTTTLFSTSNTSFDIQMSLSEKRWCYCDDCTYGAMILCNNPKCTKQWFHLPCTGLKQVPVGDWFCKICIPSEDTSVAC